MENAKEIIKEIVDDKIVALICIAILGLCALFVIDNPTAVIGSAITAIAALATGRKT